MLHAKDKPPHLEALEVLDMTSLGPIKEKGLLIDKGHDTYAPWRVLSFEFDLAGAFEWAFCKQLLYAFTAKGSTARHQRV